MSNNKKIGTAFEKMFLKYLSDNGWWAHFLSPNAAGAQPFDVIAVRNNDVYAIDCKTCSSDYFYMARVEDNQFYAFQSIIWKSDVKCGFVCLKAGEIYYVDFAKVLDAKRHDRPSIKLTEAMKADARNRFERYKD